MAIYLKEKKSELCFQTEKSLFKDAFPSPCTQHGKLNRIIILSYIQNCTVILNGGDY